MANKLAALIEYLKISCADHFNQF